MTATRVLQVLGFSAGGIARHVGQLVAALDGREGLSVDVAGPSGLPIPMPKSLLPVNIPTGPVGHRRATARLREVMADYDVVHSHGLRAGIDAGRAARSAGRRSIVTVHNLVRPEVAGRAKAAAYKLAEPLVVRNNDRTFAVSEEIASALRKGAGRYGTRIEVLYLGIGETPRVARGPDDVRRELGIAPNARLIATASRLQPQKRVDVLLRALALLPETALAVLGQGPDEDALRSLARDLGVEPRTHWLGFRDDVADVIAAADVFCLSSVWEGIPLAVQEAILLGTPVVATAVGGMPEIIRDRVSGRLVPSGDPAALAAALEEVLSDEAKGLSYAAAATEDLQVRFSTERMLERLIREYAGP